jgi:hypothetical protein
MLPEHAEVVFGRGAPQQVLLQQVVEQEVPSHVHDEPTQCWPAVEQVPPLAAVHTPPAPSELPQVFAPLQLGVLHCPW